MFEIKPIARSTQEPEPSAAFRIDGSEVEPRVSAKHPALASGFRPQ